MTRIFKQEINKILLISMLLNFGAFGLVANVFAQNVVSKKVALRVGYVPTTSWLPVWIAKEKGYFLDNGLEVTLTPTQNVSVLPPIVGKQLDFAPSTPTDFIKAAHSGLDVVISSGMTIESNANHYVELIVRKDSEIRGIQDLKNKIVATPALGAISHSALLLWLKKSGIDGDSIRAVEIPYPNMPDQLKAKRVDAIESIQPFVGQLLSSGDFVSLGDPILKAADPSLFTHWIAQGAWAKANVPTVKAFNRSLAQAVSFIESNPTEARVMLGKFTNLPEALSQKIPLPQFSLTVTPAQLDVWIMVLKEINQLSRNLESAPLIFNSP
ncbi:MAG: ABC transporter substrate-binding protein [Betaproteobacteria bacterium]|jgi:ABC-type nitrate/sulfonate/bicarbonate transport system substrate-binding protein